MTNDPTQPRPTPPPPPPWHGGGAHMTPGQAKLPPLWNRISLRAKVATGALLFAIGVAAIAGGADNGAENTPATAARPTEAVDRPTTTRPATPEPSISDEEIAELAYLSVAQSTPSFANTDDAALLGLGHELCGILDSGFSYSDAAMSVVSEGIAAGQGDQYFSDAGLIMGSAVAAFCPQYQDQIDGLSQVWG